MKSYPFVNFSGINLIQYVLVSGNTCSDKVIKRKFAIFEFQFCSNTLYENEEFEGFVVIRSGTVLGDQLHWFESKPGLQRSSLFMTQIALLYFLT
jgi:hypothetical protein